MGTGLAASAAHPRRNQIWVPPPPPGSSRNFLLRYAPDCTFWNTKTKNLPTVDSPLPHPPPARSLRSRGLGRFAPSQRLHPKISFGSLRHCKTVNTNIPEQSKFAVCCKFGPCTITDQRRRSIFPIGGAKYEKCQQIRRALHARSQYQTFRA